MIMLNVAVKNATNAQLTDHYRHCVVCRTDRILTYLRRLARNGEGSVERRYRRVKVRERFAQMHHGSI